MKRDYKLVVFDLDGTLANTLQDLAESAQRVIRRYGDYSLSLDLARTMVGRGLRVLLEQLYDYFSIPNPDPEDDLARFRQDYAENCCKNTCWLPGAEETLARLKQEGICLAMATMKAKEPALRIAAYLGIDRYVSYILTGDDMEVGKPDPWCVLNCAAHFDVLPEETVMVGDAMTDVGSALSAGALSVAVRGGYCDQAVLQASDAHYKLNIISELPGILL